jgi:hypothetical protein
MNLLEQDAMQQAHADAQEIVDILTAVSDCHMSLDLRQRLSAVSARAERIIRNTNMEPGNARQGQVRVPTVHLNGTSGEVLRHQYDTATEALRRATDAVCEARPNSRDYYVQEPGAGPQALLEHEARVTSLYHVREELVTISLGIWSQLEKQRHR